MLTSKLSGYFDCRVFKANTPKENQKMKGEDESISFSTTFDAASLPEMLSKYAKPYEDKNHNQRFRVTFKIGGKVRWYNAHAQQVEKPSNAELDGTRYNVMIDFATLNGNPDNKEACGYWANAIQYEVDQQNPFSSWMPDGDEQADEALL